MPGHGTRAATSDEAKTRSKHNVEANPKGGPVKRKGFAAITLSESTEGNQTTDRTNYSSRDEDSLQMLRGGHS